MTAHYPLPTDTIKAWAEEDRPREKLMLRGRQSLSDAELIAILLRSGTRRETAVDLARRILQGVGNDLNELAKLSPLQLMEHSGVGEAKALAIVAALEIGRRRLLTPIRDRPQVRNSRDAYRALAPLMADLLHEECWLLCLNRANRIMAREQISQGGTSGTVVDAKVIFQRAMQHRGCASIVLAHNHPSGNRQPSPADLQLTRKLVQAGQTLDLLVLDHLIITQGAYFSFADEGLLEDSRET